MKSHHHDDNNKYVKVKGEKSMSLQPYPKNYRLLRKTESKRNLPQGRAWYWLSNTKWSVLKTFRSNIMQTEELIFKNVYVSTYTYKHTITTKKKP